MNIFQFYELSRSKSGVALFPFAGTTLANLAISTRLSNLNLNKGDGTADIPFTTTKNRDYADGNTINTTISQTYSSAFTGDFKVSALGGFNDVYSLALLSINSKLNILNFSNFINQFKNLYSLKIDINSGTDLTNAPVIKGNVLQVPNSVERILLSYIGVKNVTTDFVINFEDISNLSKLKYFFSGTENQNVTAKLLGNVSKIPINCYYFYVRSASSGSVISYSGKLWASAFDTLYLPIALTSSETDNIFIDMSNSVTSAIGGKLIDLKGYRSQRSDLAVAYLESLGFTVNCTRVYILDDIQVLDASVILKMAFNNNFNTISKDGLNVIPAGTSNQPTFVSDGLGGYAASFTGTKSIKTLQNLVLNSDKVTIAVSIKTSQTTNVVITELSTNAGSNNAFGSFINNAIANRIDITDHISSFNIGSSSVNINDNSWKRIVMTIDRSLGSAQNKIYVNGSLSYVQAASPYNADLNGLFANFQLFIGQRNGSSPGYNGLMKDLEINNYVWDLAKVIEDYTPTPPTFSQKIALIGDSTIAAYACRTQSIAQTLFTATEITDGYSATNLAVPGHTINQQLTVWNNDTNKATYDIIIIQVGLNGMTSSTATAISDYQSLINKINTDKKIGAKVYISCMLPCKQRFVDLSMATGQSNWVALNTAIMDSTFTGVDGRNNYHVALLDDGVGNLAAAYDCGDHIHENQAGADIIITGFRTMIGL